MDEHLFDIVRRELKLYYEKSDEKTELILSDLVSVFVKEVIKDSSSLSFVEFFAKYLNDESLLTSDDFLASEIERIINETPLSERDKKIARLRYIEKKSEDEIADLLLVDKKTVHNNISKISTLLKKTCFLIYKKRI